MQPQASSGEDPTPALQAEQPETLPPLAPPEKKSWFRTLVAFLLVAMLSVGFWQHQNIQDWWLLRNYTPSVEATQLATQATMTGSARRIFYLQRPEVQAKTTFYKSCEEGETAIVLGCYKPGQGIFLLQVDNQQLGGVEQVTAAHEMLHAAYGRLSNSERNKVTRMVNTAYQSVTDKDIRAKVSEYQKDGADVTNELHSILGTEVANLPPDLETYYQRYFTRRATVVSYAYAYQSVLKSRRAKVKELEDKLQNIAAQVDANNAKLDAQQAELQSESKQLDTLLAQKNYDAYNAGVVAYNKKLVPFRALINDTKQLVNDYKSTLVERNKAANEAQELEKSLDSRIKPSVEDS
jgi:hypothetical protein